MRVDVTFPRVCAVCHREFTADEEFVGRVLAGSAWKNGQAVLEEGAELFETVSYHAECVPIPAARSQAGATHKPGADIENPRCTERVGGYGRGESSRPCGKPVERDGLCKRHLTLAAKRAEKNAAWTAGYERGQRLQAEAEQLSAVLGIKVQADYSATGQGRYTGNFVVDGDWLRSLVRSQAGATEKP